MNTPNNNDNDLKSLGDLVHQFVDSNHLESGLARVNIEAAWKSELGPAINKYTTGMRLHKDTLYVSLSSSVLREELSYGKAKIIKLLNEAIGQEHIKKLVLR